MTALTVSVPSANDDGTVTPGIFLPGGIGNRNLVGNYSGSYPCSNFYRFTNVTIPQGSTINSAYLELVISSYNGGDMNLNIYADKSTNSSQISSDTDYYARTRTTANSGTWNIGTPGAGATIQSPSLASVVQEIVNQGGWVSGNALTLLCDYITSAHSGRLDDYDTGTIPKLVIDYTAGGGGGSTITRSIFKSFIN